MEKNHTQEEARGRAKAAEDARSALTRAKADADSSFSQANGGDHRCAAIVASSQSNLDEAEAAEVAAIAGVANVEARLKVLQAQYHTECRERDVSQQHVMVAEAAEALAVAVLSAAQAAAAMREAEVAKEKADLISVSETDEVEVTFYENNSWFSACIL
jgi:hypothetical protein